MAGKTTWSRMTYQRDEKWLCLDGTILEPEILEETPAGRKVRSQRYPEISDYSNSTYDVFYKAMVRRAKDKGTRLWLKSEMYGDDQLKKPIVSAMGEAEPLHFLQEDYQGKQTSFRWLFEHPTLPLAAMVTVTISTSRHPDRFGAYSWATGCVVTYINTAPPAASWSHNPTVSENQPGFHGVRRAAESHYYSKPGAYAQLEAELEANPGVADHTGSSHDIAHVLRWALKKIHLLEGMASIDIPDLRDPADPTAWFTLDFVKSNVTAEQITLLTEFLDGVPGIEKAAEVYHSLVALLRSTGMNVSTQSVEDMSRALMNNDGITIDLHPEVGANNHIVRLNLTAGTVGVVCPDNFNHDAYHDWREAITIASLTGQQDELLEYARAKAAKTQSDEIDALVEQRLER